MINYNKPYQSIKISSEISNFQLIPDLIAFIYKINEKLKLQNNEYLIISVKYGKRIVINHKNLNINEIKIDDFIEIVDYNPIKKIFLNIGKHEPDFDMSFHWIIQNARKDVNILFQLYSNSLKKLKIENEKQNNNNPIDIAKDILIKLRKSNSAYLDKFGIFIIGNSLNEILENIRKIMRESDVS